MNIYVKRQAEKHFDKLKTNLNKTEAYHEMVGYVDALFQLGFINFKELILWYTDLEIWYYAEVCHL